MSQSCPEKFPVQSLKKVKSFSSLLDQKNQQLATVMHLEKQSICKFRDEENKDDLQCKSNLKLLYKLSESRKFIKALDRRVKFIGHSNQFVINIFEDQVLGKRGNKEALPIF